MKFKKKFVLILCACLIILAPLSQKHIMVKSLDTNSDMQWLISQPICHRGYCAEGIQENSLRAIDEAIKNNHIIELDVNNALNDVPVLYHDEYIVGESKEKISIHKVNIDELDKYNINTSQYQIITLEEALKHVDGKVPVLIDIKQIRYNKKFLSEVNALLEKYSGDFAIQSFHPLVLRWFGKHSPEIIIGQSLEDLGGNLSIKWILRLKDNLSVLISKPDFVSCKRELLEQNFFYDLYKNNVLIIGWVYSPTDLKEKKYLEVCNNIVISYKEE